MMAMLVSNEKGLVFKQHLINQKKRLTTYENRPGCSSSAHSAGLTFTCAVVALRIGFFSTFSTQKAPEAIKVCTSTTSVLPGVGQVEDITRSCQ